METDEILDLLRAVGEECVTPRFRALSSREVSRKRLHAPVTVADREAETRLTEALAAAYPEALVLGEEAVAIDPAAMSRFRHAEHAFTVDPVDGTRQFVKGSPDHAMMLAEVRRGEVVRSWIWQPRHRRAYVAERGAGAWRDGVRLSWPPSGDLSGWSGRSWPGRAVAVARHLDRTGTCCGIDYPRLGERAADYALFWRPRPWDHAPGALLLAEMGGRVGSVDGVPYCPQAAPPRVLVAAADAQTYDLVRGVLAGVPGL